MNVNTQWKKYLETNKPTSTDMAAYSIARSLTSEDALSKALYLLYSGFTPIKNTNRLLNGEYPYSSLTNVVGDASMVSWTVDWLHRKLKASLKNIFDIEDSPELTQLLMDITKTVDPKHSKPYSYVLVRKDLSPAQRVVQSCHAIQEVTMKYPDAHENVHMIVLQVDDEEALKKVEYDLRRYKRIVQFHTFFEPDDETGHTAIATSPITNRYIRSYFSNFELLA